MFDDIEIYKVPEDRRYWLVRADGGKYYNHFTTYGLIGLGHVDSFALFSGKKNIESTDVEVFKGLLITESDKGKSRRGQSHYTQVRSFVDEMKVGDWVLTVGHASVRFGRIVSKPYIDPTIIGLQYGPENKYTSEMSLFLRRRVVWGAQISRSKLPYGLVKSLKANQSLVSLDKNWQAIYHTLYPFFTRNDNLYLSTRINADKDISNYDVSVLFSLISEIEVIGKEFERADIFDNFDAIFDGYVSDSKLTATAKAQFYSPGDVWTMISGWATNSTGEMSSIILIYSMIFGNDKLGFSGVIDLETRKKLWDLVIGRLSKKHAEGVVDKLKIDTPSENNNSLEDDSKDEK